MTWSQKRELIPWMEWKLCPQLSDHDWHHSAHELTELNQQGNLSSVEYLVRLERCRRTFGYGNYNYAQSIWQATKSRELKPTGIKTRKINAAGTRSELKFSWYTQVRGHNNLPSMSFDVNIEAVLPEFQEGIIDSQRDTELRNTFRRVWLLEFHILSPSTVKFPVLMDHTRRVTMLFGNTCVYELFVSRVKITRR
jgi:hypothetical protein